MLHVDVVDLSLQLQDLFRLDLYVGCLTLDKTHTHTFMHNQVTTLQTFPDEIAGYMSNKCKFINPNSR